MDRSPQHYAGSRRHRHEDGNDENEQDEGTVHGKAGDIISSNNTTILKRRYIFF
jgi:hypothetical protein